MLNEDVYVYNIAIYSANLVISKKLKINVLLKQKYQHSIISKEDYTIKLILLSIIERKHVAFTQTLGKKSYVQ